MNPEQEKKFRSYMEAAAVDADELGWPDIAEKVRTYLAGDLSKKGMAKLSNEILNDPRVKILIYKRTGITGLKFTPTETVIRNPAPAGREEER